MNNIFIKNLFVANKALLLSSIILIVGLTSVGAVRGQLLEPDITKPFLAAETDGTLVSYTDSESNVTFILETDQSVKKALSGLADKTTKAAKYVEMRFDKGLTTSTIAKIRGLKPNTQYHLYKDSYANHQVFISDADGTYTFTQDTSEDHNVWLQEQEGHTVYVGTDYVSGTQQCAYSSTTSLYYGTWDSVTSTCTLNQNVNENFEITTNNVKLDCAGNTIEQAIDKTGSGNGIFLRSKSGVTVKDCKVSKFSMGIYLSNSLSNILTGNTSSYNTFHGIYLNRSSSNTLTSNTASSNGWYGIFLFSSSNFNKLISNATNNSYAGIRLSASSSNTLTSNTANNNQYGIRLDPSIFGSLSSSNTLTSNTANNNRYGILLSTSSSNTLTSNTASSNIDYGIYLASSSFNKIYNNLFKNTVNAYVSGGTGNVWNTTLTPGTNIIGGPWIGGNAWTNPDGTGFSDKCGDTDGNGICDSTYIINPDNIDYLPLKVFQFSWSSGGTKTVSGIETGPFPTKFSGVSIESFSSTGGTTFTVTYSANNLFVQNAGSNTLTIVVSKNGAVITVNIAPGSKVKLVGPGGAVSDLLIAPLTSGVSLSVTSGNDKAFPLTVQKSFVSGGNVPLAPASVNGMLVDSFGSVTLTASDETATVAFASLIADGKDFTKFKPNALIIAPEGRKLVLKDESEGQSCSGTTLTFANTNFASPLVSAMFIKNTKTGKWTCSRGTAVGGSLLMVYDPEFITEGEVPFIYDTPDHYWQVTSNFTPPSGCTADKTDQEVIVDQSAQAAVFSLSCTLAASQQALTATLSSQASDRAHAVHTARDCTKKGCPPQKISSDIKVKKDQVKGKSAAGFSMSYIATILQQMSELLKLISSYLSKL